MWTEDKIERLEAAGHGKGTRADYRPWITATMISSLGRTRRVWSDKTNRVHHLLSDVEFHLFVALEWSQDVTDVREQFPLARDHTLEAARKLGVKHPYYPGTNVATVMTVDFMVTRIRNGKPVLEAFDAKRTEDAESELSLTKLEIARETLSLLGIEHHIVLHSSIPMSTIENINWVRDAHPRSGEIQPTPDYWQTLKDRMLGRWPSARRSSSLKEFCQDFDAVHGCERGTGLRVARMLICERTVVAPMAGGPLAEARMAEFSVTDTAERLRMLGGA